MKGITKKRKISKFVNMALKTLYEPVDSYQQK